MPFNERGEIIRNASGLQQNTNGGSEIWIGLVPILVIIGITIFCSLAIYFSSPVEYENSRNENVVAELNNMSDSTLLLPPVVEYDVASDTTYTLDEDIGQVKAYNPYGPGNGRIVIYKTLREVADVKVYIDGRRIGTLSKTYSSNKYVCNDPSTISAILPAGNHTLSATSYLFNWQYKILIDEGECVIQELYLDELEIRLSQSRFAKIIDGAWYGRIYQPDAKQTYSILFSVDMIERKFKVNYPSIGCVGTWTMSDIDKHTIEFTQRISFGGAHFNPGDDIKLKVENNNMKLYYYKSGVVSASGTLTKLKSTT